jgi:hypothetical protein
LDLDSTCAAIMVGAASDLACHSNRNVASARIGNDGAALRPIANFTPSWTTITAAKALGGSTRTTTICHA